MPKEVLCPYRRYVSKVKGGEGGRGFEYLVGHLLQTRSVSCWSAAPKLSYQGVPVLPSQATLHIYPSAAIVYYNYRARSEVYSFRACPDAVISATQHYTAVVQDTYTINLPGTRYTLRKPG